MTRLASSCLLGACVTVGQIWAAGPEFEVASIKLAAPAPGRPRQGVTTNAGRVDLVGFPLTGLIPIAFRVPQSQVKGPDWRAAQRFDIQARIPAGASEDQVPEMLQALVLLPPLPSGLPARS
jgi:uncharacterized protein (TIGR03435 family)